MLVGPMGEGRSVKKSVPLADVVGHERESEALVGVLSAAALVAALASTSPASAAHAKLTSSTDQLAPGLVLTKINDNSDPSHPEQIRVLTVDPSKPVTLDLTLAGGSLPGRAGTSAMGSANGALAAINGDFNVDPGTPLHNYAADGSAVMTGFQNGASFGISKDESRTYIESARMRVGAQDLTTKKRFSVVQWNHGDPQGSDIEGYTKLGGSADRPPTGGCFGRLNRAGKLHWANSQQGVYRNYKVTAVKCQSKRMGFRKRGALILATNHNGGVGVSTLKGLARGTVLRLKWDMVGAVAWTGVMDVVGGMPLLVKNGVNVAKSCSSYFCSRNPRTGIGTTADGHVLLVTVDGRSSASVGMTLIGFADYMKSLGAVYAVNLDGGGSTTMWVAGQGIVNEPSDSTGERSVTNAVLVLPGADTSEPTPLRATTYDPNALVAAAQASSLENADPGSTGGLMDAIANGELGGATQLPPALQQFAASFRASR
jgi:hypothetical protein